MKRKITREFIVMTLISIAAAALISSFIFYRVVQEELLIDLKNCAKLVESIDSSSGEIPGIPGLRIMIISESGAAVYDSLADPGSMDNHRERPEVAQAFSEGEGQSIRESETLGKMSSTTPA